jgi:hypothetical protein
VPTDGTGLPFSMRRLRYVAAFGSSQTSNPLDRYMNATPFAVQRLMNYARCVARLSRAVGMVGIAIRLF